MEVMRERVIYCVVKHLARSAQASKFVNNVHLLKKFDNIFFCMFPECYNRRRGITLSYHNHHNDQQKQQRRKYFATFGSIMQSVGKFRPVVALLRPANHPAVQISVRYGGGGGRPGARPGKPPCSAYV